MNLESSRARIAIVSDEVSPDFGETLAVCLPLGIRAYELRGLQGGRVPYCDPQSVEQVLDLVTRYGLNLTGISPGFFKCTCEDEKAQKALEQGFDDAFALLDRLGTTRRMTVFTFLRPERTAPIPARALDLLHQGAEKCRRAGVEMLCENVPSCWGDTGHHVGEIARSVGIGITWDPGNSEVAGQPAFPEGYAAVRNQVRHLHLKNWTPEKGYTAILDGQADLAGLITALVREEYKGYFCIEPHQWSNGAQAARQNHAQLLTLLEEAKVSP